jgi:hypothetical protein
MADPLPVVLLPDQEYLEILNRTDTTISLGGWKIISGDNKFTYFPVTELSPGAFAILCSVSDTGLFSGYGKVIGMKSFPILTDGGKSLILADSKGVMIHCVEYSSSWYGDPLRSGGGWSLEMTDIQYPFFAEGNWRASVSNTGGTPGKPNSVSSSNPDLSFMGIENVFPSDSNHLDISLSEPVAEPELVSGRIVIEGERIRSVTMKNISGREFTLVPDAPFQKGKIYRIDISNGIADHAGNKPEIFSFDFGLPEPPGRDDIVFNELLFNPLPGDADYIELYNRSPVPADASWLYLSSRDDVTGKMSAIVPVSESSRLIMPGKFYAITTGKAATVSRYISGDYNNIFETGSLPSMPDDKGHLLLYGRQLELCDEVIYSDDMHFSLLSASDGVSLEKVNPAGSSMSLVNWHSASGSSGWGTPGAPNSVYSSMPAADESLQLSSTRITPDNDGIEDLLSIKMDFKGTGSVISIAVFDENGSPVRRLAENLLSAPQTYISWDGTDDNGSLLPRGIYVILVSFYTDTGRTERWKRVCSIIR